MTKESVQHFWNGFCCGLVFALLVLVLMTWSVAFTKRAEAAPKPHKAELGLRWSSLQEGHRPARLAECPIGTRLTVNTNVETGGPWRRFCWTGNGSK